MTRTFNVGDELPPLTKTMTQQAINLFEKSGGATGPSQFTDAESARSTLGTSSTVASGRMSLTFATELLRRYFGPEYYNRKGSVDLRFLRPVRPGDAVTFKGKVSAVAKEPDGCRVTVEVSATNQKGDTTAAGTGGCIVPSILVPADD
ncbi:MAG: MaoC family dehydratase [Burkholderiales bacterium]|nr:MaoC family dehydratase [Burkholderiales bacterium]